MKTIEQKINRFDGGIVNDPRSTSANTALMVTNFDVTTDAHRMIPYRSSEDGDSSSATSQKQNFCLAYWTPTSVYRLFALGVVSGSSKAEILMKDLTTGASSDLGDATWATPANNQSTAVADFATSFNLLVYYQNTGKIYGARGGKYIWAFTPDGSTAWDDSERSLTYTNIAQGLVHPKDDILYIPYDNKIAKNNAGSWTNEALVLPAHLYITSIAAFGDYLAIACAPLSGFGDSHVYLWDRDSSLATLSESINWGTGVLKVLEEVDGYLAGISTDGGTSTVFSDRVIFRYLNGGRAEKFNEISGGNMVVNIDKQKINNRLYFLMVMGINGVVREGLWSIGKSSPTAPLALVHERTPNNDTAMTSGALRGFYVLGDFVFISYSSGGGYAVSKTNDSSSAYSHNSIFETKIYDGGDNTLDKKMHGITVNYEPRSGGTVSVGYKKDGETSFTTIFTHTATTTTNSYDATTIESSGAPLPEYKEIEFQVISTGVTVTGIFFKSEELASKPY